MSYRDKFDVQSLASNRWSPEVKAKIKTALDEGKKVEWEFSSFSDHGPDWQKVLIDGDVVRGTYEECY